MKRVFVTFFVLMVMLGVFHSFSFADRWILETNQLPADLANRIAQAGGTLISTLPEVGVAVAEFANEADARAFGSGNMTVMPDVQINFLPVNEEPEIASIGDNEPFYPLQWHLPVIQANRAWDEGVTGVGARVAVLDTGIWYLHPDLAGNIDYPASISFVPTEPDFIDGQGHGTHVAGIIAAADNNWGSIGVAPNATLIAVKVLNNTGSGSFSWIMAGIIHAANVDADIINLSLGGYLKKNGNLPYYTASDANHLKNAVKKAINWAINQGTLVVISAGNEALDLDHIGDTIIYMPAQTGSGLVISATGPTGLQNFDNLASYSNYGQGTVDLAAPGGDARLRPQPNWFRDMVLSTWVGGWAWAAGTSQAAPNVCGVAALIISKYGRMPVGALENHLIQTADDLGKPGNDDFYGKGRINAYKAVTK